MSVLLFPLPADTEYEAQIDICVDLIESAASDEERDSGVDALAKLIGERSDE